MLKKPVTLAFSFIFSFTVNAQSYEDQFAKCTEQLNRLGTKIDSLYFVRLNERDSCLIGSVAPDFEVMSVKGQNIALSKLRGQVVVLNFWFTKCQPCIEEMPALNKLVRNYSGKAVKFISFAPEGSTTLVKFLHKHQFKFMAVGSSENIRRDKFKLFSAWPYTVIIDKEGRISKMWFGNPDEEVFERYKLIIDQLL
jgi:peroxiredoxin